MKIDLSKITEEDITKLYEISRFRDSIYEEVDPFGGTRELDIKKVSKYVKNTRALVDYVYTFVNKISKQVVIKNIVTAQEAREYSKNNIEVEIKTDELPTKVIETLMKRIKNVINKSPAAGPEYIYTNGIDDNGESVRGIGNYLSHTVIAKIVTYFTELGYTVKPSKDLENAYRIDWIDRSKPKLPKPTYQKEDDPPKETK